MALLEMKTFVASPEIDSWQDLAVRFRLNFWLSTRAISANLYNDNGDDEDDDENDEEDDENDEEDDEKDEDEEKEF